MKILVTGASGFVGRRLLDRLQGDGHDVVGHGSGQRPDGLDVPWVSIDLADTDPPWSRALDGIDAVIHLAALAHQNIVDARAKLARVNHIATIELFRACMSACIDRFVYLSSIKATTECTGPARGVSERSIPHPGDLYGAAKRAAEQGILDAARADGPSFTIIRPPLVHGPGVRANFRGLLKICDTGLPLPFGSLSGNRRSLIALDNLVDALIHTLSSHATRNRLFHVADDPPLSTYSLVKEIRDLLGRPARMPAIPMPLVKATKGLPRVGPAVARLTESLVVDSTAFRAATGWEPPLLPREGLARTVAAFQADRRARD